MGTGRVKKDGKKLNTVGSKKVVSEFSKVHTKEGYYKKAFDKKRKIYYIRLISGGHSQRNIEQLKRYNIEFNIVKTYKNGVRVGNIPSHPDRKKKTGIGQAWFPKHWTDKDIINAGTRISGFKGNKRIPDGVIIWGKYKGVRVGVIRTNGKIATIFPDSNQNSVLRRKK